MGEKLVDEVQIRVAEFEFLVPDTDHLESIKIKGYKLSYLDGRRFKSLCRGDGRRQGHSEGIALTDEF